ncbi:globin [Dermacoccus sp. PE3]|uniref:globin n=1 Tax=Dermacoccus sp. PE3 TaxID=1641401 RepID=UPI00064251C7|nr:globin [Dermacoccus sp. PE3]KLO62945.1 globin [Dermacoccus sp. PE3]
MSEATLYERFGGHATFHRLVEVFYDGVASDEKLRALYPEEDLEPAKHRFEMFLEQYWGGPTTYSEERGHPRLRMRHMPFAVTPEQRDRWLTHIMAACDAVDLEPELDALLRDYLVRAAYSLVNTPGPEPENPIR